MFTVGDSEKHIYLISDEWDAEDLNVAIAQFIKDYESEDDDRRMILVFSNIMSIESKYCIAFHEFLEHMDVRVKAYIHGENLLYAAILWKCKNVLSICEETTSIQAPVGSFQCVKDFQGGFREMKELYTISKWVDDVFQEIFPKHTDMKGDVFTADQMVLLGIVDQKGDLI